ncbi:MAG: VOC family protein [Patescibacteria group bacterium]
METPAKNYVLLELHVPDFKQVVDFYKKLGFEEVWQRTPERFKGYLILKKEDNILCFWAGNEMVWEQDFFKKYPKNSKRGYGVEIVLMIKNVENFYNEVRDFANVVEPLQKRPWGLIDFRIEDPFGFYLRFTELHNILDSKYAVK